MSLQSIAPNVYLQQHPLSLLGCQLGRNVTLIKQETGKVFVHSSAEFESSHIEEIENLGEPECLFEATNFHDTTAEAGTSAFPDIPYVVPPGFPEVKSISPTTISDYRFNDELMVIGINGLPRLNEYAVFHQPSKTLILADLFFNLPGSVSGWTKWFLKTTVGLKSFPGQSAYLRRFIEDYDAYRESLEQIWQCDFETIIVGHGDPVVEEAKAKFERILF